MKGSRLPVRLSRRRPRGLILGGAVLLTAFWAGLFVLAAVDPSLKPHQRQMAMILGGAIGLFCAVALSRLAATAIFGGETVVEVERRSAAPGQDLRVFVLQRGAGLRHVDARLLCLRREGRADEKPVVDLAIGAADVDGLRAQVEATVRIPADASPTRYDTVRWCVRVRASLNGAADLVEDFPLIVA